MKTHTKTFKFETFNLAEAQKLIATIYADPNEKGEVYFDGNGQSSLTNLNDLSYTEEMQKVFDRIIPGQLFQENRAQFYGSVDLKNCDVNDVFKLISHYNNTYIFVPKKDISCVVFANEYKEKNNLKNFIRNAPYKTLVAKEFYIVPEQCYYTLSTHHSNSPHLQS